MTKQEFHARIWSKLIAHNRSERLLAPGDRVLIAVSGGPDSVCLAHYLHQLARKMKLRLHALHLNHGLRGKDADKDARLVQRLGRSLELPIIVRNIPVASVAKNENRSLEDAGRKLRYKALVEEARGLGCNKIATGHQADDVAETFFLNLLRGTKAEGLAGIPPKRPAGGANGRGIEIVRPILCLSRKEVLAYLKYQRLPYATDKTNKSPKFTRNWVRLKVLPLLEKRNPETRAHIGLIAADIREKLRNNPTRRERTRTARG